MLRPVHLTLLLALLLPFGVLDDAAQATVSTPAAPDDLRVERGEAAVTVRWRTPVDHGGPAVTGYDLVVAREGGWRTHVSSVDASPGAVAGDEVSARVDGLENGVSYAVTVGSRNDAGPSAELAGPIDVVPRGRPGIPYLAAYRGDRQVVLRWNAPDDAGAPVTGYVLTVCTEDGQDVGTPRVLPASAREEVVNDLVNGQVYFFDLSATNEVGRGDPGRESERPATVPDAPRQVSAVRGDARATVSFVAGASDGGEPSTGYFVTASPGGQQGYVPVGATSGTVLGLVNGHSYFFTVRNANVVGASEASAPSAAVVPAGPPLRPARPGIVSGPGSATVTWKVVRPNGSPLTAWTVRSSTGVVRSLPATARRWTLTGLRRNHPVIVYVRAVNAVGVGPWSPSSVLVRAR